MSDKGWLGGDEAELEAVKEEEVRLEQAEHSQKVYTILKKNEEELNSGKLGLDGELIESPASYSDEEEIILLDSPIPHSDKKEGAELSKKGSASQQIMKVAGILSSLLRELIAVGSTQSWVNKENRPDQRFVAVEVEHLKEAIGMLVPFDERKDVYKILKDEVSTKSERDRIVGDILLHFAFPQCS